MEFSRYILTGAFQGLYGRKCSSPCSVLPFPAKNPTMISQEIGGRVEIAIRCWRCWQSQHQERQLRSPCLNFSLVFRHLSLPTFPGQADKNGAGEGGWERLPKEVILPDCQLRIPSRDQAQKVRLVTEKNREKWWQWQKGQGKPYSMQWYFIFLSDKNKPKTCKLNVAYGSVLGNFTHSPTHYV